MASRTASAPTPTTSEPAPPVEAPTFCLPTVRPSGITPLELKEGSIPGIARRLVEANPDLPDAAKSRLMSLTGNGRESAPSDAWRAFRSHVETWHSNQYPSLAVALADFAADAATMQAFATIAADFVAVVANPQAMARHLEAQAEQARARRAAVEQASLAQRKAALDRAAVEHAAALAAYEEMRQPA